ncbi:MAG: sugar phosphate isomerase/epimerase [Oscillospiraceae bacterium]|nr:sugar phosphate isomerase/epimerase [Oscillospiraceae bacterium]
MNDISVFLEHIYEASAQRGVTLKEALQFAKSCGIGYLECDHWRLEDRAMKQLFDSCGMGVSCIYEHFDLLGDEDISEQKYRRLFETALFYGCKKVLCIPGFSEQPDAELSKFAAGIARMCETAEEYGITVTVEDFDDIKSPCCRMGWLKYLLENVKGLRYTFDTGNFRYCLEDAGEAYDMLKQYISHVHCKDRSYDEANSDSSGSNGKADLSGAVMYPSVVGEGVIGMESLVRRLIADGYAGTLAIEHFGANDQMDHMRISAENLRSYMQK